MDKKRYNKPEMKVVLLRHRASLLEGSDTPGGGGTGEGAPQLELDEEI